MKLIYITNNRLPTEKAHGVQISKMCEAFAREGVDLELVYPKRTGEFKDDFFKFYNLKNRFKITKLNCWDLTGIIPRIGFRIQSLTFALSALLYLMKKKEIKYVYSRDHFSSTVLSFRKKLKIIFEVHWLPKDIRFYHRIFFKRVDKFVVITNGLKKDLVEIGISERNIIVAHDAVDLEEFTKIKIPKEILRKNLGLPLDKKIISYVGKYKTMGESKGVEGLIISFSKIYEENIKSFLLLVGINSNEISEVNENFNKLNIPKENYGIIGHVNRTDIPYYLKSADILVMNYPNKKHYARYMSPLKLFEYMASEVPIITSDLPSIREVLNDSQAAFFKADDIDGLAKGIINLIKNDDLSHKMAFNARKEVENYTWQKRAGDIIKFIG